MCLIEWLQISDILFTNSDNFETSYNMLYFVPFTEYDKKNPVSKISNVFLDAIKNSYALSVRTASIKIPTLINDTFEKPFLNTKITSPCRKSAGAFFRNDYLSVENVEKLAKIASKDSELSSSAQIRGLKSPFISWLQR